MDDLPISVASDPGAWVAKWPGRARRMAALGVCMTLAPAELRVLANLLAGPHDQEGEKNGSG